MIVIVWRGSRDAKWTISEQFVISFINAFALSTHRYKYKYYGEKEGKNLICIDQSAIWGICCNSFCLHLSMFFTIIIQVCYEWRRERERDDDDGEKGELNLSQNANTAHNSGNSDISGCLKHALHVLWILLFFCTRIIYYIWEEYWKDMNIDINIYKNVQNNIQYLNKRISKTALFCTFFSR